MLHPCFLANLSAGRLSFALEGFKSSCQLSNLSGMRFRMNFEGSKNPRRRVAFVNQTEIGPWIQSRQLRITLARVIESIGFRINLNPFSESSSALRISVL